MISKTAVHAVRALIVLAEAPPGGYVGAGELAKRAGAPANYLGKLLQTLAREGLVYSQKGLGGGFRLARRSQDISFYDVVDPIDQLSRWTGCVLGENLCSDATACAIHFRWGPLRDAYLKLLRETSLADLVCAPKMAELLAEPVAHDPE